MNWLVRFTLAAIIFSVVILVGQIFEEIGKLL